MKPIFTVHAGEFIVGDHITRRYRGLYNVWVPATDTGIDLLVTRDGKADRPIRIQVKASRSYTRLRFPGHVQIARGWFTIYPEKLKRSKADWWVFVILRNHVDQSFLVVRTNDVQRRLGKGRGPTHFYPTFLDDGRCIDIRGLRRRQVLAALDGKTLSRSRDWSRFVGSWDAMLGDGRIRKRR